MTPDYTILWIFPPAQPIKMKRFRMKCVIIKLDSHIVKLLKIKWLINPARWSPIQLLQDAFHHDLIKKTNRG